MNNSCENCRKVGDKLNLKGERCLSAKCAMVKHAYKPGSHGPVESRSKKSEYGRQLMEKQKARGIYGIRERQFRSYVDKAEKMVGNKAENLMKLLELRLDNIVYRLNFAISRAQARQMVSHGLVSVNGKKVTIPSYLVHDGDTIEPKYKKKYEELSNSGLASWLEMNPKKVTGVVKHQPIRDEIDTPVNENLIIEFYSR
jgi:small subunit ribosomal protein S4